MKGFKTSLTMVGLCLLAMKVQAFFPPPMAMMNESIVASGTFESVQHHVAGEFEIKKEGGHLVLELSNDFQTQMGPDLRVTLMDSKNNSPMIVVAQLKNNQGQQSYILPILEQDLKRYDTVSIYCLKYSVTFGMASISFSHLPGGQ